MLCTKGPHVGPFRFWLNIISICTLHRPTNMISFKTFITEKFASGGFDYETKVADKLKKHGIMDKETKTAGSSGDAPDAHMNIKGERHSLEVKKDKHAMFGQLELHHNDEKGWHVSPRAAAKYPKTASHPAVKDFLKKVNHQWSKPSGDYDKDLKMGNVYHTHKDTSPIAAHYHHDRKTPYVQIGGGHGLYHFERDKADLGTHEFKGQTQLRGRMKYRGTDKKTGKKKYGALMVMSHKGDLEKSSKNLDS